MKFVDQALPIEAINAINREYGDYVKVTVDIERRYMVVGCKLHADGEKILLEKGSRQDDIWGGGINFTLKKIDATAVLNLRPRLDNDSLELMDIEKRNRFFSAVKYIFAKIEF